MASKAPKKIMSREEINTIIQRWRGEGKIRTRKVQRLEDGSYELFYEESPGRVERLVCEDRNTLDEILLEFGGRNNETVAAPPRFLKLGDWRAADLEELGHRIQKIKLKADRMIPSSKEEIPVPADCGYTQIIDAQKSTRKAEIVFERSTAFREWFGEITILFRQPEEFDNLVDFIQSHKFMKDLTFYVKELGTYSIDSRSSCTWNRKKIGDGTMRIELQLTHLNEKSYSQCVYFDLVAAADGMADSECKIVEIPKQLKPATKTVCGIALEAGRVGG